MPQLKVLMLLGLHGSAPVSSLATRMGVSPPNVTGILDRLEDEKLGFVRRTNDPTDRRVVRVVLTDAGKAFLTELQEAGQERLRARLVQLRPADQRALRQGVSALLDSVLADDAAEAHVRNGAAKVHAQNGAAKEHAHNGAVAKAR